MQLDFIFLCLHTDGPQHLIHRDLHIAPESVLVPVSIAPEPVPIPKPIAP